MDAQTPVKFCRHCGRMIPQDAIDCPYCHENTIKTPEMKECPFCGELVRAKAKKCKHCGEFMDGQGAETSRQQMLYIDKAIIAGRDEDGNLQVHVPEPGQAIAGSAGPDTLLEAGRQQALPPGEPEEKSGPPARADRAALPLERRGRGAVPMQAEPPLPPASAGRIRRKEQQQAPAIEEPPARYECPSCGRYVYEDDNFCENCGRDLSIPRGHREVLGAPTPYGPRKYALLLAAAAPAGLLIGPAIALLAALLAVAAAAWCTYRIASSGGALGGLGGAVGALLLATFWTVVSIAVL